MSLDYTRSVGERAMELLRSYCHVASPRAYELWYTYVTGHSSQLNDAIKRTIAVRGMLTGDDVDLLYEAHVGQARLGTQNEKAGGSLLAEISQVMGLLDSALGASAIYSASLAETSSDLEGPIEPDRLREVLDALVVATRDVAANNKALEGRLRDSRGEVESLREMLDHVRVETLTDPLTGLANRKHFETTLMNAVESARSNAAPLTLVVVDIDHFKRFNDEFGHLTGDQVLRLVSDAMRERVGEASTLARFGGEEFAMILPGAQSETAWATAEAIRLNVMRRELLKRSTGESLGRVTISLGIASMRPDDDATTLLERADQCMYNAKRSGRNRTVTDASPEAAAA